MRAGAATVTLPRHAFARPGRYRAVVAPAGGSAARVTITVLAHGHH
jgi:hypothetical protein